MPTPVACSQPWHVSTCGGHEFELLTCTWDVQSCHRRIGAFFIGEYGDRAQTCPMTRGVRRRLTLAIVLAAAALAGSEDAERGAAPARGAHEERHTFVSHGFPTTPPALSSARARLRLPLHSLLAYRYTRNPRSQPRDMAPCGWHP